MIKKTITLVLLASILIPLEVSAMITPILVENTGSTVTSATANQFQTLAPHGGSARGAGDDTFSTAPINGTLSNLHVRMSTALSPGTSYDVFVRLNGASTGLTCTITSASLSCSDTNPAHAVSVAVGDRLSILIDPTNSPATQADVQIGVQFEGTTAGESLLLSGAQQPNNTATHYGALGTYTTALAAESSRNVYFPTSGMLDKLYVRVQNAPGVAASGRSRTITLRKNGVDTGLTCTVLETATTCTELSAATSTAPGDIFSFSYAPTNTPATSNVTASLRFVPTIDGESVMLATSGGNPSALVNNYLNPAVGSGSTEESRLSIVPVAFNLRKMYTQLTAAPGTGNTRNTYARKNYATTTLETSHTNTSVDENNLVDTVDYAAGDLITWVTEPLSIPAAAGIRTSAVMYIAPVTPASSLPYRVYNLGQMLLNNGTFILQ